MANNRTKLIGWISAVLGIISIWYGNEYLGIVAMILFLIFTYIVGRYEKFFSFEEIHIEDFEYFYEIQFTPDEKKFRKSLFLLGIPLLLVIYTPVSHLLMEHFQAFNFMGFNPHQDLWSFFSSLVIAGGLLLVPSAAVYAVGLLKQKKKTKIENEEHLVTRRSFS